MPEISVVVHGDHDRVGRELGLDRRPVIHTVQPWTVDAIEGGMHSGGTSLMLLVPAQLGADTCVVAAETSLQCWMMAANALAARFEDEVTKPGWAHLSDSARALLMPRFAEAIRRAVPSATAGQAAEAAVMILDGLGAEGPPRGDVL